MGGDQVPDGEYYCDSCKHRFGDLMKMGYSANMIFAQNNQVTNNNNNNNHDSDEEYVPLRCSPQQQRSRRQRRPRNRRQRSEIIEMDEEYVPNGNVSLNNVQLQSRRSQRIRKNECNEEKKRELARSTSPHCIRRHSALCRLPSSQKKTQRMIVIDGNNNKHSLDVKRHKLNVSSLGYLFENMAHSHHDCTDSVSSSSSKSILSQQTECMHSSSSENEEAGNEQNNCSKYVTRYRLKQRLETAKAKISNGPRRGSLSSLSIVSEQNDDDELKECDDAQMNESDYFPSDHQSDNNYRRQSKTKYNLRNLNKSKCVKLRRSKRLQNQKKDNQEDKLLNDEIVKRKKCKNNRKRSLNQVEEIDYFETNQRKRAKYNRPRSDRSQRYSSLLAL